MIIARAPARISLGGGGTDLAAYYGRFGGLVVSTAITRYCSVHVRPTLDCSIRLSSASYPLARIYPPGVVPDVSGDLQLLAAAVERFFERGLGERGVDLSVASDIPPGSGLGSSSTLAVALVQALSSYTGSPCDAATAAEIACEIEIERLGMPIGRQDQYASAFGGLNAIEFQPGGTRVTPLRLPPDTLDALSDRMLLFSTGQTRSAAGILAQQRLDTGSKPVVIESLHRIKELAGEMVSALSSGDLDVFGGLLHTSWQEKKRLSDRISSGDIDRWYKAARSSGALGGKISGAGGGGFLLLYCPPEAQPRLRLIMATLGLPEMSFGFDSSSATVVHTSRQKVSAGFDFALAHDSLDVP
jgi:D-glycero-alpha-D-manno-heptose-7-phosphate kinase